MIVPLSIESIAYMGAGVARADGCVHFVHETCPGEKVTAEIVLEKKSFKEARVVTVENPSPDRLAEPDCRLETDKGRVRVPGCVYDHVTHEAELRYKHDQLLSFLTRQAKIENAEELIGEPFVSPKTLHYRNKITLHSARGADGKLLLGYFGDDNVTVIDIPQCPLAVPEINEELTAMRRDKAFWRWLGLDNSVSLRWTEADGVIVIPESKNEQGAELPALLENTPIVGNLKVPARGFFQINPEVGSALVSHVTGIVQECAPRELLDFYCGVGVFGLSASKVKVHKVVGFDSGRGVIRMANFNAMSKGLPTRFFCEYASRVASRALGQLPKNNTMAIADPPRAGLEKEVTAALVATPVDNLVYVSCSPDTLSRDLATLVGSGVYKVRSTRIFDMFPRTAHFETATHLVRA